MKFSMECDVVSETLLDGETPILANERTYIFYPNEKGLLSKIKIITDVPDPKRFYSVTKHDAQQRTLHIKVNQDTDLYSSVFQEFQELESLLAFEFDLRGINWKSARYDLILESDEERDKAEFLGLQEIPTITNPPQKATGPALQIILGHKRHLEPLIVPMSFYREAINELLQFKHINAFINFYFVIEGLHGNYQTKNILVEREFKQNPNFVTFVQDVIDGMKEHTPQHYAKIEKALQEKGKQVNTDSVIELLVGTRGDLSHFQNNPNRPRLTPFRQSEYVATAFLARGIATHALFYEIGQINKALAERKNAPVDN